VARATWDEDRAFELITRWWPFVALMGTTMAAELGESFVDGYTARGLRCMPDFVAECRREVETWNEFESQME
jgi:hypothetical protein